MGGHGMLFFEEGRGRDHQALSDRPITSYAQQKKYMKLNGLVEYDGVPPSVAKNPKSIGLQRHMESDKKRTRWL
jgi:hypothetical protein